MMILSAPALPRPDAARDRLQGEAVLVEGPDLDRGARVGRLGLVHRSVEFFKRRLVFRARRPRTARPRRLPAHTQTLEINPAAMRVNVIAPDLFADPSRHLGPAPQATAVDNLVDNYLRLCQIKQKSTHSSLAGKPDLVLPWRKESVIIFSVAARSAEEYPAMVSDILTAVIVLLMAVLVIYPTTRVLLQSWHNWHRRQEQSDEVVRRR